MSRRRAMPTAPRHTPSPRAVGAGAVPWSSQVGQDHAVALLLGPDHAGFFIDLASNDPSVNSNTRALESLGYRGLCIEANPHYHPLYARARRRCTLVPYAVSAKRGAVPFRMNGKSLGGIVAPGLDNARARASDTRRIQAVTFAEILRNHSVPRTISYLSLDVEGAEGLVMKSFPWHKHVISLITVERPKDDLRSELKKNGYRYLCDSGTFNDELWAHSSTRFDVFSLARWPPAQCILQGVREFASCLSLFDPHYDCRSSAGLLEKDFWMSEIGVNVTVNAMRRSRPGGWAQVKKTRTPPSGSRAGGHGRPRRTAQG